MERRRFGRTGLTIPQITLGAGWVGGLIIRGDRETRFAQLDQAMAAGADWLDTAALYGQGVSESMIGEWMAARNASPSISTKFRVDIGDGADDREIETRIRASVEASFDRLGVARVPLLMLHNVIQPVAGAKLAAGVSDAAVLKPGGIADIMDRLRAEGLCDHIGFTALGEPSAVRTLVRSGRFDAAQVYYNILNPTAGEPAPQGWNSTDFLGLLADCEAADMGVMGIRVFAAGILATTERHGREAPVTVNGEAAAEERRAAAALGRLSDEVGDGAQQAIRFALAEQRLSTVVVGIGEPWHFGHALNALTMGPLGGESLDALRALRREEPAFVG